MAFTAPTLPNSTLFAFYEGTDPSSFSYLTGTNLNKAASQLKANQDALVQFMIDKLNAIANQSILTQTITATKDQTTFAINVNYVPNKALVFLNGRKLVDGTEVTTTSGTQVVLSNVVVEAGDVVDFVGFAVLS